MQLYLSISTHNKSKQDTRLGNKFRFNICNYFDISSVIYDEESKVQIHIHDQYNNFDLVYFPLNT